MQVNETYWDDFVAAVQIVMTNFSNGQISMKEAFEKIDLQASDVDTDIVDFVNNCISEIGGFPATYAALLHLLNTHPTASDIRKFMDSPPRRS